MKSYDWIIKVRTELDLPSDNQAAQRIGITRSAVSMHKNGKVKALNDSQCLRVAEILNIPAKVIIADQHAEAADCENLREVWRDIAKTISQSGVNFSIFATLLAVGFSAPQYILC